MGHQSLSDRGFIVQCGDRPRSSGALGAVSLRAHAPLHGHPEQAHLPSPCRAPQDQSMRSLCVGAVLIYVISGVVLTISVMISDNMAELALNQS